MFLTKLFRHPSCRKVPTQGYTDLYYRFLTGKVGQQLKFSTEKFQSRHDADAWENQNALERALFKYTHDNSLVEPFLKFFCKSTVFALDKSEHSDEKDQYGLTPDLPEILELETYESVGGDRVLPVFTSDIRLYPYIFNYHANADEQHPRNFVHLTGREVVESLVKDGATGCVVNPYSLYSCSFTPSELELIFRQIIVPIMEREAEQVEAGQPPDNEFEALIDPPEINIPKFFPPNDGESRHSTNNEGGSFRVVADEQEQDPDGAGSAGQTANDDNSFQVVTDEQELQSPNTNYRGIITR